GRVEQNFSRGVREPLHEGGPAGHPQQQHGAAGGAWQGQFVATSGGDGFRPQGAAYPGIRGRRENGVTSLQGLEGFLSGPDIYGGAALTRPTVALSLATADAMARHRAQA